MQNAAQQAAAKLARQQQNAESQLMKWQSNINRAKNTGYSSQFMSDTQDQLNAIQSMTAGTKEYQDAITNLRQSYNQFSEEYSTFRQKQTLDTAAIRQQEHLNNLYRQASELLRNNPRVQGT